MTDHGLRRRGGAIGLYRYVHDLSGSEWCLLLRLDEATALHLYDHGWLCTPEMPVATSLAAGILATADGLVARLALGRPETTIATSGGRIPAHQIDKVTRLAELFSSERPV